MADRRKLKPGDMLKRKVDGEVVSYVGPAVEPFARHEGWGVIRLLTPNPRLPHNMEFNVDLLEYKKVGVFDALAGQAED